ncbi:MAG: sulfurtransferase TusA family protein [Psychromonas sp.]
MEVLDLTNERCPMSLIMLKRFLLSKANTITLDSDKKVSLLFSNPKAMQDIILYLDKKNYHYSEKTLEGSCSILIQLDNTIEL